MKYLEPDQQPLIWNVHQRPNQQNLTDQFNRQLTYLRLSVTDFCNFSCDYCLPNGYQGKRPRNELTLEEIKTLVTGFAQMGTQKVRLTGGEPAIRKDLTDIIAAIRQIPGINTIAITTNGYQLGKYQQQWVDAGLNQFNISVDSFDPKIFAEITGHNRLPQILADIDKLLVDERATVKINAVLKAQYAHDNLSAALDYVKDRHISYRFIEFMQTADNHQQFSTDYLDSQAIIQKLLQTGWTAQQSKATSGPATEYHHPDYAGSIGIIAPYSPRFCQSCNRLRVSAQGRLHLCLFDNINHDLRPFLQTQDPIGLQAIMRKLITIKPEHHHLHRADSGMMSNLSQIGG